MPFILCNPPWMSPPSEATPDNPPPRWLVRQLWVLLYTLTLLPALNYNYLLSENFLCPSSAGFGFLKGEKYDIHFYLPHHYPDTATYRCA